MDEEEEEEITTTMPSSATMQQRSTHGPRQLFLPSAQGGGEVEGGGGREQQGGRGQDHDNAVLRSNETWLYSLSKATLFSFQ